MARVGRRRTSRLNFTATSAGAARLPVRCRYRIGVVANQFVRLDGSQLACAGAELTIVLRDKSTRASNLVQLYRSGRGDCGQRIRPGGGAAGIERLSIGLQRERRHGAVGRHRLGGRLRKDRLGQAKFQASAPKSPTALSLADSSPATACAGWSSGARTEVAKAAVPVIDRSAKRARNRTQ